MEDRIFEGCRTVQHTRDNIWPLDGTEEPEAAQARWNKCNENTDIINQLPMFKRRKISHNKADEKSPVNNAYQGDLTVTNLSCCIGTTTTMQNSSAFTHHTGGGFMSAAVQLQQYNRDLQRDRIAKGPSKRKTESSVSARLGRTRFTNDPDGRGTLLSFLGKEKNRHASQAIVAKSTTNASLERTGTGRERMNALGNLGLLEEISSSRAKAPITIDETHGRLSRKPLASIPSPLGNRNLPPMNRISQPCLPAADDDYPSKHHIFLSSSPPPVQELLDKLDVENEDPLYSIAHASKSQVGLQAQKSNKYVRPARTSHTTSVEQIQGIPTKTLGVRRSMTGWANRANKGFSIPSKTVGKG